MMKASKEINDALVKACDALSRTMETLASDFTNYQYVHEQIIFAENRLCEASGICEKNIAKENCDKQ